jgi:hypothetical protein
LKYKKHHSKLENENPIEYLVREVDAAIRAGLSLEDATATVMLEEYADWAQYERLREKNVEAAYRNLTLHR